MDYITIKRARFKGLSGPENLPYGNEVQCEDGFLKIEGLPICGDHSQNAYDFFARNDDGKGLERGKLTQAIRKALEKRDKNYQARWNKVWDDPLCQKYKRIEHTDHWLWNHDFYNAEISNLRHIAALVGVRIKGVA